jgi:sugar phosphate isomerase/epimerase
MYSTPQIDRLPKLVAPNLFSDPETMRNFAMDHGFDGIDWSIDLSRLPETPAEASQWVEQQDLLNPLEVRYHCPFQQVDIGHEDKASRNYAMDIFRRMIRLVAKARKKYLSLHVGLGHDTTKILSWDATVRNLRELVQFGAECGVTVALENLIWGWSSKPNLFEKLVRRSGACVTVDIGHAHACESVQSQAYGVRDFISPHAEKIINAHIYHYEVPNVGHIPPARLADIVNRLDLLMQTPCRWWVLEIRVADELLRTKAIVETYRNALLQNAAGKMP